MLMLHCDKHRGLGRVEQIAGPPWFSLVLCTEGENMQGVAFASYLCNLAVEASVKASLRPRLRSPSDSQSLQRLLQIAGLCCAAFKFGDLHHLLRARWQQRLRNRAWG